MIALQADVRVYLACGYTDMRKGMQGLAMLVQQVLAEDPFNGALFAFRGRRGNLLKLVWHDGIGLCMLTKRLERGHLLLQPGHDEIHAHRSHKAGSGTEPAAFGDGAYGTLIRCLSRRPLSRYRISPSQCARA